MLYRGGYINGKKHLRTYLGSVLKADYAGVQATTLLEADFKLGLVVRKEFLDKPDERLKVEVEAIEMTSENELKTSRTFPTETTTNFVIPDQLVNYAQSKGKRFHGHTLWWVGKEPQWIKDKLDNPDTTVQQAKDLLKYMIQTPVLRYKGRIFSWDVLNEPVKPGTQAWNDSLFITKIGQSAPKLALQYAHEADPNTLCLLNEFSWEYGGNKMTFLYNFINECKAEGVPLHGIGLQMHRLVKNLDNTGIRTHLTRLAATGLKLRLSEVGLQMRYSPWIENDDDATFILTEALQQEHAAGMVKLVNAWQTLVPEEQKLSFNPWGIFDFNYRNNDGEKEYAMLWDGNRNRKLAYTQALAEVNRLNNT